MVVPVAVPLSVMVTPLIVVSPPSNVLLPLRSSKTCPAIDPVLVFR